MAPKVNTEDLISASEVAQILGLSHYNTVTTYLRRYEDFPRPIVDLSGGRIRLWLRQDVEAWKKARPGQGTMAT
jgi:predicted DNA-binding transcriptional regulator AlpA